MKIINRIRCATTIVVVIVFALQLVVGQGEHEDANQIGTVANNQPEQSEQQQQQQVTTNIPPTTTTTTTTTTQKPSNKSNKKGKVINPKEDASANQVVKVAAQECPSNCTCSEKKISCKSKALKVIPDMSKLTNYTWISLKNNSIELLDFSKLPLEFLEQLDVSYNLVKNFTPPTGKLQNLTKLVILNLRSNQLKTLDDFAKIKLPSLQTLDLSMNLIKTIEAQTFNNTRNVENLTLQQMDTLTNLNELSFAPLTKLINLNMSSLIKLSPTSLQNHRQFSTNQKLTTLDLTNNSLIEVPAALRGTNSIKTLILNNNLMTSLRNTDFINRTQLEYLEIRSCPQLSSIDSMAFGELYNLKTLILADNKRLQSISKDSFKAPQQLSTAADNTQTTNIIQLDLLDLSGNNLTDIENLLEFTSLSFQRISLNNNPWNCNCDKMWLISKEMKLVRSPIHCKSPPEYNDMEIEQYFNFHDCSDESGGRHTLVISLFLLFLVGLTLAIVIQKNDLCRRLLFKDQYGTIYYTKASFPPETTA